MSSINTPTFVAHPAERAEALRFLGALRHMQNHPNEGTRRVLRTPVDFYKNETVDLYRILRGPPYRHLRRKAIRRLLEGKFRPLVIASIREAAFAYQAHIALLRLFDRSLLELSQGDDGFRIVPMPNNELLSDAVVESTWGCIQAEMREVGAESFCGDESLTTAIQSTLEIAVREFADLIEAWQHEPGFFWDVEVHRVFFYPTGIPLITAIYTDVLRAIYDRAKLAKRSDK